MALSADRITQKKMTTNEKAYPVKTNVKVYAGGLAMIDSAGFLIAAADAASGKVVGVLKNTVDNTGGADGALWGNVEEGLFLLKATSITQAMVGQMMYVVDDETFDDTGGTNYVKAGRLLEYVSTTSGWIFVVPSGVGAKTADADATYGQPEADLINELKAIVNKWL